MDIRIVESSEFTYSDWSSYTCAHNVVYKKNVGPEFFKQKYLTTLAGTSYHALLMNTTDIVGGCTVIPYDYLFGNERLRVGLVVDVFILEQFRVDPYALYRMYAELRRHLIEIGFVMVIAVPNDIAYPYWKHIVKWRAIGCIPYYCFPVKAANVIGSEKKFLNLVSHTCFWLFSGAQAAMSLLCNPSAREQHIRIDRDNPVVEQQRYSTEHCRIFKSNSCFSYRIVNENGVIVAYLIDFFNPHNRTRDAKTLSRATRHIVREHAVDLILFIGKLSMPQTQLLRVPFGKEPRHLHLMADIFEDRDDLFISSVLDYTNWDFGLFNYDVR